MWVSMNVFLLLHYGLVQLCVAQLAYNRPSYNPAMSQQQQFVVNHFQSQQASQPHLNAQSNTNYYQQQPLLYNNNAYPAQYQQQQQAQFTPTVPTLIPGLTCTWGKLTSGVQFDGAQLVSYNQIAQVEYCARLCGQTTGCASINWDRTTLLCELNRDSMATSSNQRHKFKFKFSGNYLDNIVCTNANMRTAISTSGMMQAGPASAAVSQTFASPSPAFQPQVQPSLSLNSGYSAPTAAVINMQHTQPQQSNYNPVQPSPVMHNQPAPMPMFSYAAGGSSVNAGALSQPISNFQNPLQHNNAFPQSNVNQGGGGSAAQAAVVQYGTGYVQLPQYAGYTMAGFAQQQQELQCGVQAPGFEPFQPAPRGVVVDNTASFSYRAMDENVGQQRIVGGKASKEGNWPWTLALHRGADVFCGAALWKPDIAITAAHCLDKGLGQMGVIVVVGAFTKTRPDPNVEQLRISKYILHENYDEATSNDDIALIKLERPVRYGVSKRPICLPTSELSPTIGQECVITGFGTQRFHGANEKSPPQLPDTLQEAYVKIIDQGICNDTAHYNGTLFPNMMCAGHADGKIDACQGDSGGPLVCKTDGIWYLQGVISWGKGCANSRYPGIYAKIVNYLSWINDRVNLL